MKGLREALEELNYIPSGSYNNEEFIMKFNLCPNSIISHLDLGDTSKLAHKLDVSHTGLVSGLIRIYKKNL